MSSPSNEISPETPKSPIVEETTAENTLDAPAQVKEDAEIDQDLNEEKNVDDKGEKEDPTPAKKDVYEASTEESNSESDNAGANEAGKKKVLKKKKVDLFDDEDGDSDEEAEEKTGSLKSKQKASFESGSDSSSDKEEDSEKKKVDSPGESGDQVKESNVDKESVNKEGSSSDSDSSSSDSSSDDERKKVQKEEVGERDKSPEERAEQVEGEKVEDGTIYSDDEGNRDHDSAPKEMTDFELMMERKKIERRNASQARRRRQDADLINDYDDIVKNIVTRMQKAADKDRDLAANQKLAIEKLKILPQTIPQLRRRDLQAAFLDNKVLHAVANWLSPYDDGSLPPLEVREQCLKILPDFHSINPDHLKSSGLGRAVMLLSKHPKELKLNKKRAKALIAEWAKPIFGVAQEYRDLDNEDIDASRRERDEEDDDKPRKKVRSSGSQNTHEQLKDIMKTIPKEGEAGWFSRARVPQTSSTDYKIRPKSSAMLNAEESGAPRVRSGKDRRMQDFQRKVRDNKTKSKTMRAANVSLSGKNVL